MLSFIFNLVAPGGNPRITKSALLCSFGSLAGLRFHDLPADRLQRLAHAVAVVQAQHARVRRRESRSLNARGTLVLQIDEPFGRRQRWLDRAAFTHHRDHLLHASQPDLARFRQDAAVGFEIER